LDLIELKIAGNESFYKGIDVLKEDIQSLDSFQEALKYYKQALEKFSKGAQSDERFKESIDILNESINKIYKAKAEYEIHLALNLDAVNTNLINSSTNSNNTTEEVIELFSLIDNN